MDKKISAGAVALAAIIAAAVFAFSGSHVASGSSINASGSPASSQHAQSAPSGQAAPSSSGTPFSSTPYAPYSYVVYPGPVSQQAQAALDGFNLTATTLQNSSVRIAIALLGSGQIQSLTIQPGYKLYVIEATFGDDGYHFDSSLGDDGFVIVDSKGYVVA